MSTDIAHLDLASRSPRRLALLAQLGLRAAVIAADVDETPAPDEDPTDYVLRLALAKARAGRALAGHRNGRPTVAADTAVLQDRRILGKPADLAEARAMLSALAGREHRVLTAVAVIGRREQTALSESRVRFRPIAAAEIDAYWATGEPHDKAGGYAIQGLGALFVEHLAGSYSGVMGLPLYETAALLAAEGVLPLAPDSR